MEKMIGGTHAMFSVSDDSDIGHLRRAVTDLGQVVGMSKDCIARSEIVSTEMATNLIKHVQKGGDILLGSLTVDENRGLELISLDSGIGMADPELMLADGVSTAGTLGGGLGAIKRLSDHFDIYSKPGKGTAILSRIWTNGNSISPSTADMEIGGVVVAKPGESVSGDRWAARSAQGTTMIVLTDGLGHGEKASRASEECLRVFFECPLPATQPAALLRQMHDAARHTQGAAVAVAQCKPSSDSVTYAAIGNIAARISLPAEERSCASMPGGIGFQLGSVHEFTYPWSQKASLTMWSDGLLSSANIVRESRHHPSLMAAIVYRDFRKGTDDATVIIGRDIRRTSQ